MVCRRGLFLVILMSWTLLLAVKLEIGSTGWFWSLVDRGLGSGGGVGPAARVQLVVGDGASVLFGSVGGQVLCSHTRGVLKTGRTGRRGGGRGRVVGDTGK